MNSTDISYSWNILLRSKVPSGEPTRETRTAVSRSRPRRELSIAPLSLRRLSGYIRLYHSGDTQSLPEFCEFQKSFSIGKFVFAICKTRAVIESSGCRSYNNIQLLYICIYAYTTRGILNHCPSSANAKGRLNVFFSITTS